MKYAAFLGVAALVLSACSSKPIAPAETATAQPVTQTASTAPNTTQAPSGQTGGVQTQKAVPAHLDPNSLISKERSVFFDYDAFVIKPEFNTLLQAHAKYLGQNPALTIRIEGNADERGGTEYNLALGQKRAEAVARALKTLGVTDKQMEAVSLGKEKPKAQGHDEAAWAQNRRGDLAYPAQ
ncbi:MAG: peptidoglycan-associated lipoprotein Pal [Rhodoferax sp.]